MQRNIFSTDGFVARRRNQNAPPRHKVAPDTSKGPVPSRYLVDPNAERPVKGNLPPVLTRQPHAGAHPLAKASGAASAEQKQKMDLDLNLDDSAPKDATPKPTRKRPPLKKIAKWAGIIIGVVALVVASYFVYRVLAASGKIFQGNPIAALFNDGRPLKQDANGQTNVVVYGTSMENPEHDAPDLTDSMMLMSVNQERKDGFMISIPRDLWIDYGRACPAGYQGKINAYFTCIKGQEGEQAAQAALQQKVGEVFGLDVQYGVHVTDTALRQAVDAVGGITVLIESDDPRGILDRNFDWDCPNGLFTCYNVKYPNGPVALDGKQAVYLARARGASGLTYGLAQANFDREGYQRKIIIALQQKAVSAGTLANPVAVNELLGALGDNVRTNFDVEEIKTIVRLGREIPSDNVRSVVLNDPDNPLVTTGNVGDQSIVRPVAGLTNFSELQAVVRAYATGDIAAIEGAIVDVFNASEVAGLAQDKAVALRSENITVGAVGNAPATYAALPVHIYDMSAGAKPATLSKLEAIYDVKVNSGVPAGVTSTADFVIIFGTPQP